MIGIKFDFGVHFNRASTVADIRNSLASVVKQFVQSDNSDDFESVPGLFGDLVEKLRAADTDVMEELINEVFKCENTCEYKVKVYILVIDP